MNKFDVTIIGSGIGGLLCAVMLAGEGFRVAVIEQNKQIGGCLQTYSFQKKVFDSCVHYIGALDYGQTQHRIFNYAGIAAQLKLKKLDENGFDQVIFNEESARFPIAQGFDRFKQNLLHHFPDAVSDIDYYITQLKAVTECFPLYSLRNGDASEKAAVTGLSLQDVLGKIKNEKLLQVLLGNSLLYAGCWYNTPFYVHALVIKSYIDSAYKCEGGSSQISKLLWKQLQELGGTIFRNEKVITLKEEGSKIISAQTENGNEYFADTFIANVHPATAMQWIDSSLIKPAYRKRILGAQNSVSAFMLNIVLEPGKVPYHNHNIYWNKSDNSLDATHYKPSEWPANYALYYNEDANHKGFAETVTVLTYMHANETDEWKQNINNTAHPDNRGDDYDAFKEAKSKVLLDTVAQRFPEIKAHTLATQAASPLTFRDYMGTPDGSMYGIMADVNHLERTQIPIRTKFENLFLTGQNVGIHGVLGVSINAVAVCGELLGLDYLLEKIHRPFQ